MTLAESHDLYHAIDALLLFCRAPLIWSPTTGQSFTVNEAPANRRGRQMSGGDSSTNRRFRPPSPFIPCVGSVTEDRIYGREWDPTEVTGLPPYVSVPELFRNLSYNSYISIISNALVLRKERGKFKCIY